MSRAVLAIAAAVALAGYTLPDPQPAVLAPGPERDLVEGSCTSCHSWDYVTTQPRGMGEAFWRASVAKMVDKYGAPMAPADADAITRYLARTQG